MPPTHQPTSSWPRHHRPSLCSLCSLWFILLLLLTLLPTLPAAAQSSPSLSATPGALEATVALGGSTELDLTLTNPGGSSLTPRLFSAYPASGPAQLTAHAPARVPLPASSTRVDPALATALAASPDGRAEALVFLADQADLSAAYALHNWAARGELVYRTLRDHAENSQRELRAALDRRGLDYTPLWIVNALVVRGAAPDLAALAGRAEVAELRAVRTATLEHELAQGSFSTCEPDAAATCWNVARVGASRVWNDFGVRGEGIVVANIDSGVRFDHPALIGQYRGNRGGTFDHNYSWFDLYGDSPVPVDSGDHGTHTMGSMVARSLGPDQPAVGVAPGARWVSVRACGIRECSEQDLLLAAQWMLAPTDLAGNNPRPDLRPQVVNNSWTSGKDSSWFAGYTAAWRAAGIFPVFAAGNSGNRTGCGTVQSPGDYGDVTAVGATDAADRLTSFSSIGPGPSGRVKPDLTAPGNNIWSTLGSPGRAYGALSGTSMAAPHVAAAAALVMAANPALIGDYDAVYAALTAGADPLVGDSRFLGPNYAACAPLATPNNIYGHGRLNAYAAVARASISLPWLRLPASPPSLTSGSQTTVRITLDARFVPGPGRYEARILVHGDDLTRAPLVVPVALVVPADPSYATVSGRLVRAADGLPIRGTVTVSGGATAQSDDQGRYSLTLPPATAAYTLTADARDYLAREVQLLLGSGQQASQDFALAPDLPRLALDAGDTALRLEFGQRAALNVGIANSGTRALTYTAGLAFEPFGVWRSDEPDGPPAGWTDPPPNATALTLSDDGVSDPVALGFDFPLGTARYRQIYVLANGVISFVAPAGPTPFNRSCLPLPDAPGPAIVPLHVDLDPSQAGARVSYAPAEGGMLVSWERVPLFADPARRLSFQALLLPDGRVRLRYRDLSGLTPGESASYGIQLGGTGTQSLGCQTELGLDGNPTLELRPQPLASLWLRLDRAAGQVAPGSAATLALEARWARPAPWPLSGTVVIATNDPLRPTSRVSIRLTTTTAPNSLWLPLVPNRAR